MNPTESEVLVEILEKYYGIKEIKTIELIPYGYLSHNWKITTQNHELFFKQYRPKSGETAENSYPLVKRFSDAGIPIILPRLTKKGEVVVFHQNFFYSLFPFVQGYGPRAYELVRSLIIMAKPTEDKERAVRQGRIFLKAYQDTFFLEKTELHTAWELFYLDQCYSVWIEKAHYIDHTTKTDELLEGSIKRIEFLKQYREELFNAITNI